MPPSASISSRWAATSSARTAGTADTALTAAVVSAVRMSASTGAPSRLIETACGSVEISIVAASTAWVTATASARSTPLRSAATVAARYIAPVSR